MQRAKNSVYGPAIDWYSPLATAWITFLCWALGHSMPPWSIGTPQRKRDKRWCERCGSFGEWREGWLTNEQYHNEKSTRLRA